MSHASTIKSNIRAEQEIDKKIVKLFLEHEVQVRPLKPLVLVRVLPKERVTPGGIVLAGNHQNKPIYEGVVMRTWEPKYEWIDDVKVRSESALAVGDHVLFPHWAGWPIPGFSEDYYRMVPELTPGFTMDKTFGGIVSKYDLQLVNTQDKFKKLATTFVNKIKKLKKGAKIADVVRVFEQDFKEEFDYIIKLKGSQTSSGKAESVK